LVLQRRIWIFRRTRKSPAEDLIFQLQFRFSAGTSGVPPTIWIFRLKIPIFGGTFETPAELLIFRGLRFFAACGKRIQPDLFAAQDG
jgi:hypothetical protein